MARHGAGWKLYVGNKKETSLRKQTTHMLNINTGVFVSELQIITEVSQLLRNFLAECF